MKNSRFPQPVKSCGEELAPEAGLISLTMTVPEEVPSLFHNSVPLLPSVAAKNKVLPTAVRFVGRELPVALMSFTITVPDEEPSVFHNSVPLAWVAAAKYSVLPTTAKLAG